ncbi:preprotein translocase subunit SecB [Acetoanaerobium pronyense]|uniref:Preprotein translocase subunit SecB n=1 Tax=Acetoanaerobium pronyense TaxID=1482736 RepID=A0ABS4KI33_9FIRM|nr:protein-export chaperone SecB [Acetoanaerobium pronyense]MBP2027438.1 preprotein translocase subunit SecB [Acetoanaerobium pronyense]
MKLDKKHESFLTMENLFFSEIIFKNPNHTDSMDLEIDLDADVKVDQSSNVITKIKLNIISEKDDDFFISITAVGKFKISEVDFVPNDVKQKIVKNNTIAILFPYIRSQVTLLTSQPNFKSFVFPVVNINSIFESEDD